MSNDASARPEVDGLVEDLVEASALPFVSFARRGGGMRWNAAFALALGGDDSACRAFVTTLGARPELATAEHGGVARHSLTLPFAGEPAVVELVVDGASGRCAALVHRSTRERTAAEALHRALSLQQATFDATTEGVLVTDVEENALSCNRKLIEHFDLDPSEVASWTTVLRMDAVLDQVLDPEAFVAVLDSLRRDPDAERPATIRLRSGKTLEMVTRPRRLEGMVIGRVFSFLDVTARVRAEQALLKSRERLHEAQKVEAVGRLAGGIAHDFNNLLTVIGSYASLVQLQRRSGPSLDDALQQILRATERAAELTRQLLAFGRQQVLEPRVVDLHAQLREASRMIERVLGDDIELSLDLRARAPTIRVDPGQLDQVLLNLAINARDAMPDGGELVIGTFDREVRAGDSFMDTDLPEGRYVGVRVTDAGTGMPEAVRARVFEPFFTTKEPGKGTGLGLATVHGIVHQSGGHVAVASQLGLGTTFRMWFPRVEGEAHGEDRISCDAGVRGSGSVLVVEDSDSVRTLMRTVLEAFGYEVATAVDGADGLRVARSRRFDLVVSDVSMPRLSGPAMVAALRAQEPSLRVLFVSGFPAEDPYAPRRSEAESLGAPLLHKPFSPAELAERVAALLAE